MKPQDPSWWLGAIAISLLVHGLALVNLLNGSVDAKPLKLETSKITHVRLNFPPPPPVLPEPIIEPEPKVEPPKPKPISKPKPVEPKPVDKAPEPPREITPVPTPPPVQKTAPISPQKRSLISREEYLATLLAHIEKRKSYPRAAHRRGVEGSIKVSFTLGCDGTVSNIRTAGGHKLLKKSASKAVMASLPLPKPPTGISCPMVVNYAMAYKLK